MERKGLGRRPSPVNIAFSQELKWVIRTGEACANDRGDANVSSEHPLLRLVYHPQSAG
jgi:hypothetical protein